MMDSKYCFTLLLLACSLSAFRDDVSVSKFYDNDSVQNYNCSVFFEETMYFDCACVSGLWILYESCSENSTTTGDVIVGCQQFKQAPVSVAVQVVRNQQELAVIEWNGKVTILGPETVKSIGWSRNDWAIVAGSNWTLIASNGKRTCVSVIQSYAYCIFTQPDSLQLEVVGLEKDCNIQFDYLMKAQSCKRGKSENICETGQKLGQRTGRALNKNRYGMVKATASNKPTDKPKGIDDNSKVAPTTTTKPQMDEIEITLAPATTDDDEDAINVNANNTASISTTLIADELLVVMDTTLDEILGLRPVVPAKNITVPHNVSGEGLGLEKYFTNISDSNPMNTTYSYPPYEFLIIAKRITQKSCPSFYVKSKFLDLAVAVFIRLQQLKFKFMETLFKPAEVRRVLHYLRKCERHATKFNFSDANCDGVVDGTYHAFGETIELLVTSDLFNLERDPIIETVWKIFYNAHSYCFPFFEKKLDHHRFTTWMIPLFQNQIGDIWTAGETTEQFFNGIFGNQIKVQENLAYCAASSRLGSEYPFDLPRPDRVAEFGPTIFETDASEAAAVRRKRSLEEVENYLTNVRLGSCLDTSKPLLCPAHVKSIINQTIR